MPIVLEPDMGRDYARVNRFVALFGTSANAEWFEKNIIEAKLPSLSFAPSEYWDGMVKNRFVNSGDYSSLGLSFYVELDHDPVYGWIQEHLKHSTSQFADAKTEMKVKYKSGSGGAADMAGYKRDIDLLLLDGEGQEIAKWRFLGCQLSSVTFDQLTYRNDAILTVSIEVLVDRVLLPQGR